MVAELDRSTTSNLRRRTRAAGDIILAGVSPRPFWLTGNRAVWLVLRLLGAVVFLAGAVFLTEMATGGDGGQQMDLQQLGTVLQQILAEQQQQRTRLDDLGQAVQGTGVAVQTTQQTTEQIVQQVVQQVQAGFAQGQQTNQDQMQQVAQSHLDTQNQIAQLAQTMTGLQTQLQQAVSADQFQQIGAAVQGIQTQMQHMQQGVSGHGGVATGGPAGVTATGGPGVNGPAPSTPVAGQSIPSFPIGTPPPAGTGAVPGAGAVPGLNPMYGGSGATGSQQYSAAVAYAIQQGGIDGRAIGKPTTYDPTSSKLSFQDWTDSIITLCDSTMPGIYEVLEWIVNSPPKTPLDVNALKLKFHHLDPLLLDYAESNVYAILTTYTGGEARSLVRQARRPNGAEAFRLLQVRFNPATLGRQRASLIRITNPTGHVAIDKLASEIVSWENRIVDYESRPGADKVSDSMRMAALIHMCPAKLQEHLQLNAVRVTTYLELREEVFTYLDQVAPVTATTMDVGSLDKRGCFLCGGPHLQRDCKSKGNGKKGAKGKDGKGKSKDGGGKGKGKSKFDGKGKGAGKKGDKICQNCGKAGHLKEQCWHKSIKPLNAVDPQLKELQSQYARAAMEEYQRRTSPAQPSTPLPASTPISPTSQGHSPTSPPPPVQTGSLVIKRLCALSRRDQYIADRLDEMGRRAAQGDFRQLAWRMRQLRVGGRSFVVTIDSGAAASVCPPGAFPDEHHYPPDPNLQFVSASGDLVPELYKVRPVVMTEEGYLKETQFSVAQVNKILLSAAEITNRGHVIVLTPNGENSYIYDMETEEYMKIWQEDGVYVQYLRTVHPRNVGFQGPAPWMVPTRL